VNWNCPHNATRSTLTFLTFGLPLLVTGAVRAAETDPWWFSAGASLFMGGLSGGVTARGIPAEIDASFGDIVDNLEFGAAGRFTVGHDRWLLSTEVSYMGLGASTSAVDIDLDQWLVEPSVGYKFSEMVEGFAGVRYNSIKGDVRFNGPLGNVATGTHDWFDPIVGVQSSVPLVERKLALDGRFDVGGFGVGSDLTWQAFPFLNWRFAKRGSAQLGYRWLGTDYENGSGSSKFVYDVVVQGPQIGFTVHF